MFRGEIHEIDEMPPYDFSSLNVSVKKEGSELRRSIFPESFSIIVRHRFQKQLRLESTKKGFSGYEISFPM